MTLTSCIRRAGPGPFDSSAMSTAAEPPRLSVTRPGEARLHRARALACDTVWVRSSPFISDALALAPYPYFPRLSLSFSLILTCSRVPLLIRLLVCPHSSSHPPPPPLSLLSRSQARSFAVSTHLSLSEMTFSLWVSLPDTAPLCRSRDGRRQPGRARGLQTPSAP